MADEIPNRANVFRFTRIGRRAKTIGVLVTLCASLLALAPNSVAAYPGVVENFCPPADVYRYTFNDAVLDWSGFPNEVTYTRVTLNHLNDELDYSTPAQPLADIEELNPASPPSGAFTTINIFMIDDPTIPAAGYVSGCNFVVNLDAVTAAVGIPGISLDEVYGLVARHEVGHVLGMAHAGIGDDVSSLDALMATCSSPDGWVPGTPLQRDTSQYLNYAHNDAQYRQMTANGGFENGTKFFLSKDMSLSTSTATAASGSKAARLTAQKFAYNSYIYQTSNFWYGTVAASSYRNAFRIRERNVNDNTLFRTRLFAKRRNDGSTQTCPGPTGPSPYLLGLVDPNNVVVPAPLDPWVVMYTEGVQAYNSANWSSTYTSPLVFGDTFSHLSLGTGYKIQMRVYGRSLTSSGQPTHFWVDEARLERGLP